MWELSPEEVERELAGYDGAIAYIDSVVGQLMDALSARGVLDDTLVVITADHGEQFGEHGLFNHANSVYTQTTHVPLVVFGGSRARAGTVITEPVSLRNLPATILELAGVESQGQIPGDSLSRIWEAGYETGPGWPILSELNGGGFTVQDWYPNATGDVRAVVLDRYHYIRSGNGAEEVYDLHNDPMENENLVSVAGESELLGQLRRGMDDLFDL